MKNDVEKQRPINIDEKIEEKNSGNAEKAKNSYETLSSNAYCDEMFFQSPSFILLQKFVSIYQLCLLDFFNLFFLCFFSLLL